MKKILLLALLAISQISFSQVTPVVADIGVGLPYITDLSNNPVNPNMIGLNSLIRLHVDLTNFEQNISIPSQTFQVVIGLGPRLILAPAFDLSTAPLSNLFSWSSNVNNGQVQIVGTLINTFPADFYTNNTATFDLQAAVVGGPSTISVQYAFVNNNAQYNLSDPNSSNNNATLQYTVITVLPVTYTQFNVKQVACDINANWSLGNELNVNKYQVETSKDGINFVKVGEVPGNNQGSYKLTFALNDQIKAPSIFVRIKAIDLDGYYHYSDVQTVSGTCDQKQPWKLYVYPNPVSSGKSVTVTASEGMFDGRYRITLVDNAGRTYKQSEVSLDHVTSYKYDFGTIASGKYIIRIINVDGTQITSLPFEKL